MNLLQAKLAKYTAPQEAKAAGIYPYFRAISSEQDPEVVIDGRRVLMFGSNCYSGLVNDPRIKEAAIEATRKYGTGCAGSPFLNGTLDLHKKLEARLAEYIGKEDVMIYSTGFGVNLGVVSTLTGREDYILWDEQDHASIIEGRRLSFSQSLKYKHNDMDSLEKQLAKCAPDKVKLIVTDGVFSMEGDVANLPKIVELAKKYDASVMVDEAHGIGVFGEGGRGTCNHFGVTDDVDLIMGTFSKSLASLGGYMAASAPVAEYVRHTSRPFIFSASIPPANTAAALAALRELEAHPELVTTLQENAKYMRGLLNERNIKMRPSNGDCIPIIPIYTYEPLPTLTIAKELYEGGVYVNSSLPPAAAPHECLLRTSLMATHTHALIDEAVGVIAEVLRRYAL